MMNRARVLLPSPADFNPIPYEAALQEPLADQVGAQIEGVDSQEAFHTLLAAQGRFMLNALSKEHGSELFDISDPALRQLRHAHQREVPFVQDLEASGQQLTVQVMYPFAPQYGYMQATERAIGHPLRMSLGLARKDQETGTFTVGHTNLWIAADRLSPKEEGYQAIKDTIIRKKAVGEEEVPSLLSGRTRSRARSGFVLSSLIER